MLLCCGHHYYKQRLLALKGSKVTIDHVSKRFGDFVALDDVDFTIEPGEFFSLLGPSGCGKTTLLRIIAGFEFPDSGAILFNNRNIIPYPPDKRSSNTVFQTYALFPHMSVMQNVLVGAQGATRAEREACALEQLKKVQLDGLLDRRPHELSGGECQRAAIARAMSVHPEILICDEATSALDVSAQAKIVELLMHLRRIHNVSILFITHDLPLVSNISDRILIMNEGELVEEGSTEEVITRPKTVYTRRLLDAVC